MNLARYTPAEARVLENHYIAGAIAEGIWGKGIPPKSLYAAPTTGAGKKRCSDLEQRLQRILSLIAQGYDRVATVRDKTRGQEATVRKHFAILAGRGLIELHSTGPQGEKVWRIKTP